MFSDASHFLPMAVATLFLSMIFIDPVMAQSLGGAENVLNTIVNTLTGNIARLITIIACIFIGFAFLFGYVDLRTVGYFVVGAIIVFGAKEIVELVAR